MLNKDEQILNLYNKYIKEICDIKDISRWTSKKTITAAVLNPERTNEQKVYDAVKNIEGLQEGDKVQVYFKSDRSLGLERDFNGDYDKKGLLEKLFKSALIFEAIYPVREKLLNYALQKNFKQLCEIDPSNYVKNHTKDKYDIYIGRPSIWGNPFSHQKDLSSKGLKIVESREKAIEEYEKYLLNNLDLLKQLPELKEKKLGCWCAPKSCHGEILAKYSNNPGLIPSPNELKSLIEGPEDKYIAQLPESLKTLIKAPTTLPKPSQVFRALTYFKPWETKVIIIGQDPYLNAEDACGLAFSVEHGKKPPPSLINVFNELGNDLGYSWSYKSGNLEPWAKQGVLLLNSVLTTEEGKSAAHKGLGWEQITTKIIQRVLDYKTPIALLAWGKYAKDKLQELKIHDKVLVLEGGHPSPLGQPEKHFFGGKYFSKANEFLKANGVKEIDWRL